MTEELLIAGVICLAGGFVGGIVGVGGGILFVPALTVVIGLDQVDAESTSLLMIMLVSIVGTARQRSYGNVNLRDAVTIGLLSPVGVVIGVIVSNEVPGRALELGFAALALFMAYQLVRNALSTPPADPALTAATEPVRKPK